MERSSELVGLDFPFEGHECSPVIVCCGFPIVNDAPRDRTVSRLTRVLFTIGNGV